MSVQPNQIYTLQSAATANGNGTQADCAGVLSAQQVEITETAGGSATVALQGSFDSLNWYAIGYQQVDNQATVTRAVANLAVTANSKHVYQLLDPYPQTRAVISAIAGGGSVNVRLYGVS